MPAPDSLLAQAQAEASGSGHAEIDARQQVSSFSSLLSLQVLEGL